MPRRTILALLFAAAPAAFAQFSPGPLSRAHERLEGPTNCTACHEVGEEIAGSKCLDCHAEIRASIERRTGYHAVVTARQACVDCHKEHLGRDAKTYLFDQERFDHDLTGFSLSGKHGNVKCGQCHADRFVRDPLVKEIVAKRPKRTWLGLGTRCADCHADVHRGSFGPECSTCHNPSGWRDVRSFDHSRTKFRLAGKHAAVACEKCHKPAAGGAGKKFAAIAPAAYADCTPCHATPHRQGSVKGDCSTCHDPAGWALAMGRPFDHSGTRYPLEGGHARVACASCHPPAPGGSFEATFRRPFARCLDCHSDRHEGAFAKSYGNDCARCHSVRGWAPSSFSFERHQSTGWPLTGSHRAVLCADCHRKGSPGSPWVFRMKATRCEACHEDVHRGQFAAQMKQGGCESCHTTAGWKGTGFQHGTLTAFPLEGKHASVGCEACHRETASQPPGLRKYAKLAKECESCHEDRHRSQFASAGKTDCARCHSAAGWRPSVFDHETQSAFRLTGAHARVRCAECHRIETAGGTGFTRYKPLSAACESCHRGKESPR